VLGLGIFSHISAWMLMPMYLALSMVIFIRAEQAVVTVAAAVAGFAILAMLPYVFPVGPSKPKSSLVRARSMGNPVPVIAHAPSGFRFVLSNAAVSRVVSRSSCS